MNQALLDELKKVDAAEETILKSGAPVLSYYVKDPNSTVVDSDLVISAQSTIGILKHPRFVDFPSHSHNYLEIAYVCCGSFTHTINDSVVLTLEAGDLLFLQQGTRHAVKAPGYEDIAVHFLVLPRFLSYPLNMLHEDTVLRRFIENCIKGIPDNDGYLFFHLQNMLEAQNLLENMVLSLMRSQRNNQRILQATMGVLLLELSNRTYKITLGAPNSYEQQLVLEAMAYIEENYPSATLDDFCRKTRQPSYYVSRLMKRFSPYTFTKYLQKRRLSQAVYLLTETLIPIEEIIVQVGYENSSHFHRLFKQEYGINPREYRTRHMAPDLTVSSVSDGPDLTVSPVSGGPDLTVSSVSGGPDLTVSSVSEGREGPAAHIPADPRQ